MEIIIFADHSITADNVFLDKIVSIQNENGVWYVWRRGQSLKERIRVKSGDDIEGMTVAIQKALDGLGLDSAEKINELHVELDKKREKDLKSWSESVSRQAGRPVTPPDDKEKNIIADLRRATGWSQAETAEKMGVTQEAVSLWERGKREISGPALILAKQLLKTS